MKLNFDILVAGQTPPQEGEDDLYQSSAPRSFHPTPCRGPRAAICTQKEDIARVMHYTTADQYDTPRNRDKDDEGHDEAHEDGSRIGEGDESESSSVENPFEKPMKVHVEMSSAMSVDA